MPTKPRTKVGYSSAQTSLVRSLCLYVATKLGDLMDDLVIVGGLVPSLIIDQEKLAPGVDPHVGTEDLDLGLSVVLLDEKRYQTLTERLRGAGFEPDRNEQGNPTRQRWVITKPSRVTMDFLIAPTRPSDRGGRLRDIEPDFAALLAPGLHLAFQDVEQISLKGLTLFGETAVRDVKVCGAGAFVVLKSFALRLRGENKDAYDLYYVLRNFGSGPSAVAQRLKPLLGDEKAQEALRYLKDEYADASSVGPKRAAAFVTGDDDSEIQQDAADFVRQLFAALQELS